MSGSLLTAFGDFVLTTGPSILKGPEEVVNDAVKNTYTLPHFIEGKSMQDMVQGGSEIRDIVYFDTKARFENYQPNASFTYSNPQFLTQWSVPWRFSRGEMVWTDHEVLLNTGNLSTGARHHKFKTLKRTKEMDTWTSFIEGLDDQFWARPAASTMEAAGGDTPYSIPAFVNEYVTEFNGGTSTATPGLFGSATSNVDVTAWSTVMGIDPSSQAKWRNFGIGYNGNGAVTGATQHLFQSMTQAWFKVRFDKLPRRPDLSDPVNSPQVIFTSILGISSFERAAQANQDLFVTASRKDPSYGTLYFRGVPLQYIAALDDAALYPTGSASATIEDVTQSTEDDDTNAANGHGAGARYYFIDGRYMLKAFHNERYFYKKPPFQPSAQPFTNVCVIDTWHNNTCRSRQRHALVWPTADLL